MPGSGIQVTLQEMQTSRFSSSMLSGPVLLGEDGGTYQKQITHVEKEAATRYNT